MSNNSLVRTQNLAWQQVPLFKKVLEFDLYLRLFSLSLPYKLKNKENKKNLLYISITKSTASRAAKAKISAQETIPGHMDSSCFFASSITSKPFNPTFAGDVLSADGPEINTEASQPYILKLDYPYHYLKINVIYYTVRKRT